MTKSGKLKIERIKPEPMEIPIGDIFFLGECPVCKKTIDVRQLKEHFEEMNDDHHMIYSIMKS